MTYEFYLLVMGGGIISVGVGIISSASSASSIRVALDSVGWALRRTAIAPQFEIQACRSVQTIDRRPPLIRRCKSIRRCLKPLYRRHRRHRRLIYFVVREVGKRIRASSPNSLPARNRWLFVAGVALGPDRALPW